MWNKEEETENAIHKAVVMQRMARQDLARKGKLRQCMTRQLRIRHRIEQLQLKKYYYLG